jgi:formylmethanofuran dehydrogenase subunit E
MGLRWVAAVIRALVLAGCAARAPAGSVTTPARSASAAAPAVPDAANSTRDSDSAALASIAAIHGGAGPWVVAGYRMGLYAIAKFGLTKGSRDLEVVHYTPREVQFSCMADGAAAATGASLGRLNLSLVDAPVEQTRTTYRQPSTGRSLTLRTTAGFAQRYLNVARPQLRAAGAEVLDLPDAEIFEEVATSD